MTSAGQVAGSGLDPAPKDGAGPGKAGKPRVAIIIVSYRGPDDVERCLRSIAQSDYDLFDVFICENGGGESFDRLVTTLVHAGDAVLCGCDPSGDLDEPGGRIVRTVTTKLAGRNAVVRLGEAIDNLGYGGGVNAWLERILPERQWDAVLILNPDTEISRGCLSAFVLKSQAGYGMIGGALVFDDAPDRIINFGLHWSRLTGRVIAVGRNESATSQPSEEVLDRIDAISGACVFVTRSFLDEVGLMYEDYFLYMEDLDWGQRRGGQRIGYEPAALVRHVGGTSIGSAVELAKQSRLSIYLSARNSMLHARRRNVATWPIHLAFGFTSALRYAMHGRPEAALTAISGLIDGLKGKTGRPNAGSFANSQCGRGCDADHVSGNEARK